MKTTAFKTITIDERDPEEALHEAVENWLRLHPDEVIIMARVNNVNNTVFAGGEHVNTYKIGIGMSALIEYIGKEIEHHDPEGYKHWKEFLVSFVMNLVATTYDDKG